MLHRLNLKHKQEDFSFKQHRNLLFFIPSEFICIINIETMTKEREIELNNGAFSEIDLRIKNPCCVRGIALKQCEEVQVSLS